MGVSGVLHLVLYNNLFSLRRIWISEMVPDLSTPVLPANGSNNSVELSNRPRWISLNDSIFSLL